jgi:hypothetical protein
MIADSAHSVLLGDIVGEVGGGFKSLKFLTAQICFNWPPAFALPPPPTKSALSKSLSFASFRKYPTDPVCKSSTTRKNLQAQPLSRAKILQAQQSGTRKNLKFLPA